MATMLRKTVETLRINRVGAASEFVLFKVKFFVLFLFQCKAKHRTVVTIYVLWLFLTLPWIGVQCVIVVFTDHTHLRIVEHYKSYLVVLR